jgi:hypothetical protein
MTRRGVGRRVQTLFIRDGSRVRPKSNVEETMKIIASSLLVLGLLAIQVSEANAVVCAAGAYHAGCASARGAVVRRPVGAAVVRPYGAAVVRPAYGVHRRVVY